MYVRIQGINRYSSKVELSVTRKGEKQTNGRVTLTLIIVFFFLLRSCYSISLCKLQKSAESEALNQYQATQPFDQNSLMDLRSTYLCGVKVLHVKIIEGHQVQSSVLFLARYHRTIPLITDFSSSKSFCIVTISDIHSLYVTVASFGS